MGTIILHDADLTINTSKAELTFSISKDENIFEKIEALAHEIQSKINCKTPGYSNSLHIFCNCTEDGLELGSGINETNIKTVFRTLKYKIGNIYIHSCNALSVYRFGNNGLKMFRNLAQSTYAYVTACGGESFEKQTYLPQLEITWTGSVATWNQMGRLVLLREFSNAGLLLRTIDHPGELIVHNFKAACKRSLEKTKHLATIELPLADNSLENENSLLQKINSMFVKLLHVSHSHVDKAA